MPRVAVILFSMLALTAMSASAWSLDRTLVLYPKIQLDVSGSGSGLPLAKIARVVTDQKSAADLSGLQVSLDAFRERDRIGLVELRELLTGIPELAGYQVLGPESVQLDRRVAESGMGRMLEEAVVGLSQYVTSAWPTQYRNLKFSYVGKQQGVPVSASSEWTFDYSDLKNLQRRISVWVEIHNGTQVERIPLWFQVDGEVMTWKTLQPLAAKTVAENMQFLPGWASLTEVDPTHLTGPVENRRISVAMKADEVLTINHLEAIPAVEYGQDVQVVVYSGNIELVTEATAMRTAHAGEVVSFRSNSSEEEFEALVVARNRARIGSPAVAEDIQSSSGIGFESRFQSESESDFEIDSESMASKVSATDKKGE